MSKWAVVFCSECGVEDVVDACDSSEEAMEEADSANKIIDSLPYILYHDLQDVQDWPLY